MLSILIPSYNTPIYELVTALHNEVTDLNIAFEICVCDDASTLYQTENKRIQPLSNCRFFQFEHNKGRTFTRDFLAQQANYKTLLFLDADVLPTHANFLATYLKNNPHNNQVVMGGYNYREQHTPFQSLRWTFGKQRENIPTAIRNSNPYKYVFSGNFAITKNTYNRVALPKENRYGMDILFSEALRKNQIDVIHIDNTIDHLGLESNAIFLKKSLQAVKLRYDYRDTVQTSFEEKYQKLKAYGVQKLCSKITALLTPLFLRNLQSKKPNMFVFDLYRFGYYCRLHSEKSS